MWVVINYYLIGSVILLMAFILFVSGSISTENITTGTRAAFEGLSPYNFGFRLLFSLLAIYLQLRGVFALYLLRCEALNLLVAGVLLSLIMHLMTRPIALPGIFDYGIKMAFCLYIWNLIKKGALE
jgi:hypothetical protein